MKHRFLRLVAIVLLATLAFTQASVAFSACLFERGSLAHAVGPADSMAGCDESTSMTAWNKFPHRCFAHCASDLQSVGAAVALVRAPAASAVLVVHRRQERAATPTGLDGSPPGAPPPRILLHSFLI